MRTPIPARDFVGRRAELAALEKLYKRKGPSLTPVFGPRRVGKSELVLQFMRGKPGVYFLADRSPGAAQRCRFLNESAMALGVAEKSGGLSAERWDAALRMVLDWAPANRKVIICLDEFPWLCKADPDMPSVLFRLWEEEWGQSGRVTLLLTGSHIGTMEGYFASNEPLFGRRVGNIRLLPLSFQETRGFLPDYAPRERVKAWALCGGYPFYLRMLDPALSAEQNMTRTFLDPFHEVHEEDVFLLREEIRNAVRYRSLMMALSRGNTRPADLARETGMERSAVVPLLDTMMQLGLVEAVRPLGEEGSRRVRYRIANPALRTLFAFVQPHQSILRLRGPEPVLAALKPRLDIYWAAAFEEVCRQSLPLIYVSEGVSGTWRVGEYWSKDTQIDVAGLRDDGWVDVGECKWGRVSLHKLLAELQAKAAHFAPAADASKILRGFVTRTGLRAIPGLRLHTLSQIAALGACP
ncbi:MAG: ATP-binding protein [Kiritimatiellae bacterium]|nr:ATP-binding protein [Kiritimatiellia bacterium]